MSSGAGEDLPRVTRLQSNPAVCFAGVSVEICHRTHAGFAASNRVTDDRYNVMCTESLQLIHPLHMISLSHYNSFSLMSLSNQVDIYHLHGGTLENIQRTSP